MTTTPNPTLTHPTMIEDFQRRERCAQILGSYEMLVWYSRHYNETLPQTRLRFQKEMIGMDPDDPRGIVWEDATEENVARVAEKGRREREGNKEREKEKEKGGGSKRKERGVAAK
ncbi:hypothetical protein ACLMJK_005464 [Lecanora helva]